MAHLHQIQNDTMPRDEFRKWIGGRLPVTQAEWDTTPKDYKLDWSKRLAAPAKLFLDSRAGTCLAPVVIVSAEQIELKPAERGGRGVSAQ